MDLPKAPSFSKIIGPSFILLGLGLGSGELILWPYLTANWGLGIVWGAILGVTLQFFINMEIERYTLVKGESVFVGFSKISKIFTYWFIASTFIAWIWPGIIATSARLLGEVTGFSNYNLLGIGLLVIIGIILSVGPILYKTVERFSLILTIIGLPSLLIISLFFIKVTHINQFIEGIINFGNLPQGLPMSLFLAAFAFSGAGGNLNLAQSFYIKEKGYGMGKYGGKITSLLLGKVSSIKLDGQNFPINKKNMFHFKKWWKIINLEHFIVFWVGGVLAISLLAVLSYALVFGREGLLNGVDFVVFESQVISSILGNFFGMFFLIIAGIMLFNTQLTVLDATSRILAENVVLIKRSLSLSKMYYLFLWMQIFSGVLIFLTKFSQPLLLITISAVLNAFSMFIHIALTNYLNIKKLHVSLRPSLVRQIIIVIAFLFFGYFSYRTI